MISIKIQIGKQLKNVLNFNLLVSKKVIDEVGKELKSNKMIWMRNWKSESNEKGGYVMLLQLLKSKNILLTFW